MDKFIQVVTDVNSAVNDVVWGIPALILLIGTGILMTILTKGFQFTRFGHMIKETIGGLFRKKDILKSKDKNSISQFQALCTALSATIGTGNIAGIAYAITMGGPGAVFWMWIAAIVGMMTNYSENVLGIFFRRRNKDGEWCGGAMYYLRDGLGSKKGCKTIGKVLAVLFSIFTLLASFGIGNMGQVASIRESVLNVVSFTGNEKLDVWIIAIVVMIIVALVILGGLKRIARTNERIVPFMAIFYIIGAIVIVCMHIDMVGPAFAAIFEGAFNTKAAAGGVGGYVAEGLARCGVGELMLIDNDTVSISNINRQIIATQSTIGKAKTSVVKSRLEDINPQIKVNTSEMFILPENANEFDFSAYDYIVDAIDTVSGKIAIIINAQQNNIPVISSMGTGNKLDPTAFEIDDIYKTSVCPLARVMRHELKKRNVKKLKVLYSKEKPLSPLTSDDGVGKRIVPGSVSFVPSVAGLIIAGEVIKDIVGM